MKKNDFDDRPPEAQRLTIARMAKGFETPKDAARFYGWSYETYHQHEKGTRGLPRALNKYAKAFGVSPGWILTGEGQGPANQPKENGLRTTSIPIGFIKVTGKVAANTWLDVDEMDFGYDDIQYVPSISGHPEEQQFALVVDGNCLNKIAPDGTILACLRLSSGVADVVENDLVIVERRRFGGQMVERTAKRVRQTLEGFELWPESTDPAHQEPIRLSGASEGEEILVIGKVLWVLRKP